MWYEIIFRVKISNRKQLVSWALSHIQWMQMFVHTCSVLYIVVNFPYDVYLISPTYICIITMQCSICTQTYKNIATHTIIYVAHTYTYAHMHACTCAHTHTHTTHTRTRIHTCTHTYMRMYAHTHIHVCARTHIQTDRQTHTHLYSWCMNYAYSIMFSNSIWLVNQFCISPNLRETCSHDITYW